MAAFLALVQNDIKKVLAYSTISQLAYMVAALGLGEAGYAPAMFHLFTHAFFKALLFLGAGSVIHAVHSNDMREMGGLRKPMPTTFCDLRDRRRWRWPASRRCPASGRRTSSWWRRTSERPWLFVVLLVGAVLHRVLHDAWCS